MTTLATCWRRCRLARDDASSNASPSCPAALGGAAAVLLLADGSIAGATVATLIALVLSAVAAFSVAARFAPAAAVTFAALWLACELPLADHRWPSALATLWIDQPLAVTSCAVSVVAVVLDV